MPVIRILGLLASRLLFVVAVCGVLAVSFLVDVIIRAREDSGGA
jgi:hypothetical protein